MSDAKIIQNEIWRKFRTFIKPYVCSNPDTNNDITPSKSSVSGTKGIFLLPFSVAMGRAFEKSLCLGTGIAFGLLSIIISVPNAIVLTALYRNPLRCFRKTFSVFLMFMAAVDLYVGLVVSSSEAITRFVCAIGDRQITQEGETAKILAYIGVNSSILLVTAMSVDRFVAVVFPHFYLHRVKPRKLALVNTSIVVFSLIFASIQLTGIPIDVYLLIDIHLHTTFPLTTTILAYMGIFFVFRKRSRVDFQRQTSMLSNQTLHDRRRLKNAQTERKLAATSFLIVLFLIISLIPYFVAIILETNCDSCFGQQWLFALRESLTAVLLLNSAVNPILTSFRINELKNSVKIVLRLRKQPGLSSYGNVLPPASVGNVVSSWTIC